MNNLIDYLQCQLPVRMNDPKIKQLTVDFFNQKEKKLYFKIKSKIYINIISVNENFIIANCRMFLNREYSFCIKLNRKINMLCQIELKSEDLENIAIKNILRRVRFLTKCFEKFLRKNCFKFLTGNFSIKIVRIDYAFDICDKEDSEYIEEIKNLKRTDILTKMQDISFFFNAKIFTGVLIKSTKVNIRIYNKYEELTTKQDYRKKDYYQKKYKFEKEFWRFEFEIRSKFLKEYGCVSFDYDSKNFINAISSCVKKPFEDNLINLILTYHRTGKERIKTYFKTQLKIIEMLNKDMFTIIDSYYNRQIKLDWYKKVLNGYKDKIKNEFNLNDEEFFRKIFDSDLLAIEHYINEKGSNEFHYVVSALIDSMRDYFTKWLKNNFIEQDYEKLTLSKYKFDLFKTEFSKKKGEYFRDYMESEKIKRTNKIGNPYDVMNFPNASIKIDKREEGLN